MAAELVHMLPDKFKILAGYSPDLVRSLIRADSQVKFLQQNEVLETQFGCILLQGKVEISEMSLLDEEFRRISPPSGKHN